jgi:hypothetical protein
MSTLSFYVPGTSSVTGVPLLGTLNLNEHELIVLSTYSLREEIAASGGTKTIVSEAQDKSVIARLRELSEWVRAGNSLIVRCHNPQPIGVLRNGKPAEFFVELYSPVDLIKLTPKSGTRAHVVPSQREVSELLTPYLTSYNVVMSGEGLIPLITVQAARNASGPPDVVAGYMPLEKGLIVFAPGWGNEGGNFWKALVKLPAILRRERPALPDWVDNFKTADEVENALNITAKKAKAEKLLVDVAALESQREQLRHLKSLFTATGAPFEESVRDALSELGFEAVAGPHPRADILAFDGNRVAAVEAKGIEGAAREEHARQVMVWSKEVDFALSTPLDEAASDQVIGDYKAKLRELDLTGRDESLDCKGILVLGTFRSQLLPDRTQHSFGENVEMLLKREDVCAMTGLQLYCLVITARAEPEKRETIRAAIMQARGVLEAANDWSQIMQAALSSRQDAGE